VTRLEAGSASLVGQVRTANEDAVLVTDTLAAVADGMGGHRGGAVASASTVEVLGAVAGSRSVEDLVAAVHRANRKVHETAAEDEDLRGMGTTICAVGLVVHEGDERLAVLNVGDSRVYLLADGELTQLTEDHSLVEALVREGRISAEEAEVHPQRNVLTRALGVEAVVVVDAWLLEPCDGDRLLLCSDGLFNELADDRIREVLAEGDPPEVTARRLAAEADAAGGRDNVSTVVIDVSDTGRGPSPVADRFRRITTPAVDLSDLDDGPHTATVLAVVSPPTPDADGPTGGAEGVDEPDASSVDGADSSEERVSDFDGSPPGTNAGGGPGRWRTLLFLAAVAAVVAIAVGAVAVAGRQGWYVAEDDGRVALFRGRPGGVLWIQGTVEERSDLLVEDLSPARQQAVRDAREFATAADGRRFIENLERSVRTTTSTTSTTTTSVPPATTLLPPVTVPAPGPANGP
jgi:protein phosphatase